MTETNDRLAAAGLITTPSQVRWSLADQAILTELADHMANYMPHCMFSIVVIDRHEPRSVALGPTTKAATDGPKRLQAQRLIYAMRNYANKLEAFLGSDAPGEMAEMQTDAALHDLLAGLPEP